MRIEQHVHTSRVMSYDSGSHDLAVEFLADMGNECEECRHALSIAIQTAIENHLRDFEEDPAPRGPSGATER